MKARPIPVLRTILRILLIVLLPVTVAAVHSDGASASFLPPQYTGCLNLNAGTIKKIAEGVEPTSPCSPNEAVFQFTGTEMTQEAVEAYVEQTSDAILFVLDNEIESLDVRIGALEAAGGGDVAAEAAARIAADDALQAAIDAEAASRTAADVSLQSVVDSEEAARTAADTALQQDLDAEAAARIAADDALQAAIDTEAASRVAADVSLQSALDIEQAVRIAADTAFASVDSILQAAIDAEAAARAVGDAALQAAIDNEEAARIAADTALQNGIDAEEAARVSGDAALQAMLPNGQGCTVGSFVTAIDTAGNLICQPVSDAGYELISHSQSVPVGSSSTVTASCSAGKKVLGGGYNAGGNVQVHASLPVTDDTWGVFLTNLMPSGITVTVNITCAAF